MFRCDDCGKKFTEPMQLKKVIPGENLLVWVSPCCQSEDFEPVDENEMEDLTVFMGEDFLPEEVEELEAIAYGMGEDRPEDNY